LNHVDGLLYGDNPSEGIVRGTRFLHPELRIAVDFPRGWDIENSKSQVVAKAPQRNDYVILQVVPDARGSIEDVATTSMSRAGFRQLSGGSTQLNGSNAYVSTWQGNLEGLGNVIVRTAHIPQGRTVYLLAGIAPPNEFQSADREFASPRRFVRTESISTRFETTKRGRRLRSVRVASSSPPRWRS
jgi:predicted Zn-dependent protease